MTFRLLALGLISTVVGVAGAQAAPDGYGGGSPMHGYGNAPEVHPQETREVRPREARETRPHAVRHEFRSTPCHCVAQVHYRHHAPIHFAYETRDYESSAYESRYDYAAAPLVPDAVAPPPAFLQPAQYAIGAPQALAGGSSYNFYGPTTNYFGSGDVGPSDNGPPRDYNLAPTGYDAPPPGYDGSYGGLDAYDQARMDPWHGYDDREF